MTSGRGWAAVLLVLALGACSVPKDTPESSPSTPANAGLGNAPVRPAVTVTSTRPAVTVTSARPAVAVTEANFMSPSGNIGCYVDKVSARCDILKKAWEPPPAPTDCELDWAGGISLFKAKQPEFTCAGDTVLGSKETLKYGNAVRAGDFTCGSERAAMRCENTASGHGFTLSAEKYDMF
jgi:hypothetical protein